MGLIRCSKCLKTPMSVLMAASHPPPHALPHAHLRKSLCKNSKPKNRGCQVYAPLCMFMTLHISPAPFHPTTPYRYASSPRHETLSGIYRSKDKDLIHSTYIPPVELSRQWRRDFVLATLPLCHRRLSLISPSSCTLAK